MDETIIEERVSAYRNKLKTQQHSIEEKRKQTIRTYSREKKKAQEEFPKNFGNNSNENKECS